MADHRRIYVERAPGGDTEARDLLGELRCALGITRVTALRCITCYDVFGLTPGQIDAAAPGSLFEAPRDRLLSGLPASDSFNLMIAREYLPGQFDQRSDSAARVLRLLHPDIPGHRITVSRGDIFLFSGALSQEDIRRIRRRLINPVESREKNLGRTDPREAPSRPPDIPVLTGFRELSEAGFNRLKREHGIALAPADLEFIARWFTDNEDRDPNLAELKVLDAYWSDHCRHTTFETELSSIHIEDGLRAGEIQDALNQWNTARENAKGAGRPRTLMDLATVAAREARRRGGLDDWELSEEINACTLKVNALIDGERRPWLLSFKNETHNHPTEIEPRGGASTCLGGAVRDPLSGRMYVHQALRVSGGGDPRLPAASAPGTGKLPQHLIARGAAEGYSGYGNQLGLPCTLVREVYHPGYRAKRLECGAVMGAAPADQVIRRPPAPGDAVILVGGRTGRDGIGGAAGSSLPHDEGSLGKAGAEVQKGNPLEERKLQRLFRNPLASRLIERCNDFGAGGAAVAVGELAEGLLIDLDALPVKYTGLDGLELALSESQERMAVVVHPANEAPFIRLAQEENLEAARIAEVSSRKRLRMMWRGKCIIDLDRRLLDTNGVRRFAEARIPAPEALKSTPGAPGPGSLKSGPESLKLTPEALKTVLSSPGTACRRGLEERFDGTVGGTTLLAPRGGRHRKTPAEASVHLFPGDGKVETAGVMSSGFDPHLTEADPFRGGQFALIDALAAVCAAGARWRDVRFSLQEYFGRTDRGPDAWGRPLAALLGALTVQRRWGLPAIGGKDSMSGSFEDMDVPPTLIAFAACAVDSRRVIGAAFPRAGLTVCLVRPRPASPAFADSPPDSGPFAPLAPPDFDVLAANWDWVSSLSEEGRLACAARVSVGGWAAKTVLMALGGGIGLRLTPDHPSRPFTADYGGLIIAAPMPPEELTGSAREAGADIELIGETIAEPVLRWSDGELSLTEAEDAWSETFRSVWPLSDAPPPLGQQDPSEESQESKESREKIILHTPPYSPSYPPLHPRENKEIPRPSAAPDTVRSSPPRPRVCIPVFPGTNGEDDARRAFHRHGAIPRETVFLDARPEHLEDALKNLAARIRESQILFIAGGFSAGDEPDGAGKYIAAVLREPRIADAVHHLLSGDGLILGICNGFQALIKSGWLINGAPGIPGSDSPTLMPNRIGHHVARIVRTVSLSTIPSPWLGKIPPGSVHSLPVSHGEGRLAAGESRLEELFREGRAAFQYCDETGRPSMAGAHNPNGSAMAVEGLLSPCGRILGKMAHSERWRSGTLIDVPGMETEQPLIAGGVQWFR